MYDQVYYFIRKSLLATLIGFVLFGYSVVGQALECSIPEPTEAEIRSREAQIKQIKQANNRGKLQSDGLTFLPIRFNVVRRSDGTGGASLNELNMALATANKSYLSANIQFYMAGYSIFTVDDDELFDFEYAEESTLTQGRDLTNAINVYIVGTLYFQSRSSTGYGYYPSTSAVSNRIVIRGNQLNDERTLPHELGHYFNVLHTFHNTSSTNPSLKELVTRGSGANCSSAGDLVCDTPADPFGLSDTATSGCLYTGTAKDANGELYTPALDNMMSYYYYCGNRFTPGQYERMEGGLVLRTNPNNEYTLDFAPISRKPSGLVAAISGTGVVVSFEDNGVDAAGYIIERAEDPTGPFTVIAGLGPSEKTFNDGTVAANTSYYYRVRASNAVEYSELVIADIRRFYCLPNYDQTCSPVLIADFLLRKNGVNLVSNLNTGCGDNSYSDFVEIKADVIKGESYDFQARAVTNGSGSYFPQNVTIWIDYNHNGVFESSERVFQSNGKDGMQPTALGSIVIPQNAILGPTRLRVRSQYDAHGPVNDPCGKLLFGEAEDYTLVIKESIPLTIQTTSVSDSVLCEGGNLQVSYNTTGNFEPGNIFTVQVAAEGSSEFQSILTSGTASPLTAILPDTLAPNVNYQVRVVGSQPSVTGTVALPSVVIRPKIQALISGSGSITLGDSATLTITKTAGTAPWRFTLSDSTSYNVPSEGVYTLRVAPQLNITYTLRDVANNACGSGTGNGSAIIEVMPKAGVTLAVKVFLEGPYQPATSSMTTTLNQRGLLPGQTPISSSATPTPAGHPYGGSPWFYEGSESVMNYDPRVVDWVLVSFRAASTSNQSTICKKAALLMNDGFVQLLDTLPNFSEGSSYYIVIEHRNHLGVMSHDPVVVKDGILAYDFTAQDSYVNTQPVLSFGQKKIGTIFAMGTSDGNKGLPNQHYVINASDYVLWNNLNGQFDLYSGADYNMDAQISASDKVKWSANNSKFSLIGRY